MASLHKKASKSVLHPLPLMDLPVLDHGSEIYLLDSRVNNYSLTFVCYGNLVMPHPVRICYLVQGRQRANSGGLKSSLRQCPTVHWPP